METTRPTISIKNHINGQNNVATKKDGVNRLGDKYKFTTQTHFEIIDFMERVREKLNMNKAKFSVALGYSDSAYQQWCTGSRFSRTSYAKCMHSIHQMHFQKPQPTQQLSLPIEKTSLDGFTLEQAIAKVKAAGLKVSKQVVSWEEL